MICSMGAIINVIAKLPSGLERPKTNMKPNDAALSGNVSTAWILSLRADKRSLNVLVLVRGAVHDGVKLLSVKCVKSRSVNVPYHHSWDNINWLEFRSTSQSRGQTAVSQAIIVVYWF